MDAIRRKEWQMFFYLSKLAPETGYVVFSVLHIPLFFLIFWGLFSVNQGFRHDVIIFLSLFFIIHFFLHIAFLNDKKNEFDSIFSWFIIIGICLSGLVTLLLQVIQS